MRISVYRGFHIRRLVPVLALAAAVTFGTGLLQSQSSDRAKQLGGKLICTCGCTQILTACNHVGCTVSGAMLKKMDQRVDSNESDNLILQSFVQEYGEQALAEPPTHGFNSLAWFIPGIAAALGFGLVILVIRQWSRPAAVVASGAGSALSPELLDRVRREIEHETED